MLGKLITPLGAMPARGVSPHFDTRETMVGKKQIEEA